MKKLLTFTALASVMAIANANAAGFHLREQSAAAQGNAFAGATAGAENISYAYFNVAGLTRHKGTQMNLGGTYIAPEASAHNINGSGITGEESDVHNIVHAAIAPNMTFSHQLNDDVTVGLAVNVPFGMVTKYDTRWAGAHHGATSKVTSVTTTPMVAWRATDKLSVGAGLPIQYFKAKLTSGYNGVVSRAGIDYTKVEGDTVDVGYQLGAMYELNENTRFGINYRSEINHKLKGEVNTTLNSYNGYGLPAGTVMTQDITARVDTPAMLSVGAYHKLNDKWEIMGEYQRVYWNSFDSIDIYNDAGLLSTTRENWRDANFYAVGASYQIDDQWKLRLGLAYDEAAVKLSDRTPRIPDSNRMWYSVGLGYQYNENVTIDAAFTYIKAKEASVDMNGTENAIASLGGNDTRADYENSVKMFGLSLNYKF